MRDGLDAYRLLKSCDERDPLYMTLDISASVDGDAVQTQAAVCRTRVDGTAVTCIQRGEVQLYYANGAVYLKTERRTHWVHIRTMPGLSRRRHRSIVWSMRMCPAAETAKRMRFAQTQTARQS